MYIIGPIILVGVLLFSIGFLWFVVNKKRRNPDNNGHREEVTRDEKVTERENTRNCQQVYTSSPVKSTEKIQDDVSGR